MENYLENVHESKELLQAILDNIESALMLVDENARIMGINHSGTILFSKAATDIIGELCGNVIDCIHPHQYRLDCGETEQCSKCNLRQSINYNFLNNIPTKKALFKKTFWIDGNEISKTFSYSTQKINVSGIWRILIVFDDISEEQFQKESLLKLNEEKNRFLSIAAHDLRSPISVIEMYAKTFLHLNLNNLSMDQQEMIEVIIKKSKFTLSLLEDLLNISRIESGTINLNLKKTNYSVFIDNIISSYLLLGKRKEISIHLDCRVKSIQMNIDEMMIEQALTNLIQNAVKFSRRGSRITIRLTSENKGIKTAVIDEGVGIPLKDQKYIFQGFMPHTTPGTEGEKSTGIGLSIVKRIIEAHGGKVGFESEENKGSTFFYSLPLL